MAMLCAGGFTLYQAMAARTDMRTEWWRHKHAGTTFAGMTANDARGLQAVEPMTLLAGLDAS